MPKPPVHTHEQSACPRCHRPFVCQAGSISQCQCQPVRLTDEQRHYVSNRFEGCLCADCLRALRSEFNQLTLQNKAG